MKERPILFSAPMVRAILDGSKTQTRRVLKRPYENGPWTIKPAIDPRFPGHTHDWWLGDAITPHEAIKCPYGQVGDQLWVREAWRWNDGTECGCSEYCNHGGTGYEYRATGAGDRDTKWKPSIHMPRKASRIQLEITDIRVEHLQSVTYSDAVSEGVTYEKGYTDPREAFQRLWESINGPGSWDANPWVWVVEFKLIGK